MQGNSWSDKKIAFMNDAILYWTAKGKTAAWIGDKHCIHPTTVCRIRVRLGVKNMHTNKGRKRMEVA